MCSWKDLGDGSLTMSDLMDMHRSLNLKEYLANQSAKQERDRERQNG